MIKILIIAGLTATGKTAFAVEAAKKYNGELISADSRQVYKGMDIVTGKDKDKIDVPIWLYDLVNPNEPFSVSQWRQKALEAIQDIHSRNKLPIVVGGTGLYLRSLFHNLENITVPPNETLRKQNLSVDELQKLLGDNLKDLNASDRQNPRRLIRAIEIAQSNSKTPWGVSREEFETMSIVLTAPKDFLLKNIYSRVHSRLDQGAVSELDQLTQKYGEGLPSFTACGYQSLLKSSNPDDWIRSEYQYARRQKVFFKKYLSENHFDVSLPFWNVQALAIMDLWINTS